MAYLRQKRLCIFAIMSRPSTETLTRSSQLVSDSASTSRCVKRLSLQVSQQLHREAKLAAIEDEETINSMVVSLLRRHLKERREAIEASQRRGSRLSHGIY